MNGLRARSAASRPAETSSISDLLLDPRPDLLKEYEGIEKKSRRTYAVRVASLDEEGLADNIRRKHEMVSAATRNASYRMGAGTTRIQSKTANVALVHSFDPLRVAQCSS